MKKQIAGKVAIVGKEVINMIKKGREKQLAAKIKQQPVTTTVVEHIAVSYYDDHTGSITSDKIYKVVLKNGKVGMAVAGTISSINAFDFDNMELSRQSIGGNFYNRPEDGTLEEAIQKYNESVIVEGVKIQSIYPV